eukprot:4853248-Amphidinium_carterae.1
MSHFSGIEGVKLDGLAKKTSPKDIPNEKSHLAGSSQPTEFRQASKGCGTALVAVSFDIPRCTQGNLTYQRVYHQIRSTIRTKRNKITLEERKRPTTLYIRIWPFSVLAVGNEHSHKPRTWFWAVALLCARRTSPRLLVFAVPSDAIGGLLLLLALQKLAHSRASSLENEIEIENSL